MMDALTYFTLAADPLEATFIDLTDEHCVFHLACISAAIQGEVPIFLDGSMPFGHWPAPCRWDRCPVKSTLTLEN